MIQTFKSPAELINNRLSRRGYTMEESQNVLQKRKGTLIYLKREKSNIRDYKRFC